MKNTDRRSAIEAPAPHAFSVHCKNQAIATYDDGFLLGDILLGEGSFDLQYAAQELGL